MNSQHLEQARSTHPAADAHRHNDVLRAAPLPLQQRVPHLARSRHPKRVADRDGAAVDVELLGVDAEDVGAAERYDGERLRVMDACTQTRGASQGGGGGGG